MMSSMLTLRPVLLILSLGTILFYFVQHFSQYLVNPLAVATHLQPLMVAAILCIPLSYISHKLKHS